MTFVLFDTMAAKRPRLEPERIGDGGEVHGDSSMAAVADTQLAMDEETIEERVADLEAAMDRLSSMHVSLRRQQSQTAILLTRLSIHVDRINLWTAWLQRVYHWLCHTSSSDFPWN